MRSNFDGTLVDGVVDNAASVVALLRAADALKGRTFKRGLRIVFFDQEERENGYQPLQSVQVELLPEFHGDRRHCALRGAARGSPGTAAPA